MNDLKNICRDRVLVFDGAMGTSFQKLDLSSDDFGGKDGCNEYLNLKRPGLVREIHAEYFKAGCQAVLTNTFGASSVVLAEYDLADQDYEINLAAAKLAKEIARDFSAPDFTRYVGGSIGPGTKLPSLGHISFTELTKIYERQVAGLVDGGVDLLLVETCQDLLQMKAALVAIFEIFKEKKLRVPVMAQVTMETTGKMLVGSDIQTVILTLAPFEIDVLGLNCATGPKAMTGHIRALSRHWDRLISVQPNAGIPHTENGKTVYDLTPEELALDLKYFVTDFGVNIIGGCCGTTPEHLKKVAESVRGLVPQKRNPQVLSGASSLYSISPYEVTPKPLIIGERNNANGSKVFRNFLLEKDWDGMVSIAKQQEQEQAHVLDICTAYVGEDEIASQSTLIQRLNTEITLPLMIDSTQPEVIEAALQRISGKAIVNSVNLENGPDRLREIMTMCKKYGAAVVALTIDEEGMAKTSRRKIEIARRIFKIITEEFNFPPEDILFDTLTFTLGSGDPELRTAAVETMDAIRAIKQEFPKAHTVLGLSNISFGLKPGIRHRLNSVFLSHAIEAGLDAAILHPGKIMPLYKIKEEERRLLDDLIFNRKTETHDPLLEVLNFYKDKNLKEENDKEKQNLPVDERLKSRIIDGNRIGLEKDLDECLNDLDALEIVNQILLDGMKTVGELFGSGRMQLPFVLQSAETMKAAVAYLQPHLEKTQGTSKGKIVLATVKGDVHDIGKNLVDIILTNNGFEVNNIGIKQNIEAIVEAYQKINADAIGMSGLLVKSTLVMQENLLSLNRLGIHIPVILGGAALTRSFVEDDLQKQYEGKVFYAKDAFEGLSILSEISK